MDRPFYEADEDAEETQVASPSSTTAKCNPGQSARARQTNVLSWNLDTLIESEKQEAELRGIPAQQRGRVQQEKKEEAQKKEEDEEVEKKEEEQKEEEVEE